jgi:hypothetical protein
MIAGFDNSEIEFVRSDETPSRPDLFLIEPNCRLPPRAFEREYDTFSTPRLGNANIALIPGDSDVVPRRL